MKELKRIRLGNYVIGMRLEKLPHTVVFRSMFSRVADTSGVLNKFNDTDKMCLFIDFDDKQKEKIDYVINDIYVQEELSYILMRTSENHYNLISPTLIHKDRLDRLMKKYLEFMDYRFAYVYFRDGYNAIRIVQKSVSGQMKRPIEILHECWYPKSLNHLGLCALIDRYIELKASLHGKIIFNNSHIEDCIIREYETINW